MNYSLLRQNETSLSSTKSCSSRSSRHLSQRKPHQRRSADMHSFRLPDLDRLRLLPERAHLAMLAVALDLADSALRIEHPCLDLEPPDTGRLPPPTELLAELLL